jgi:murein DD-endopeptidase
MNLASRVPFILTGLGLLDTPYIWDGKDPGRRDDKYRDDMPGGLDCSGFVTWCFLHANGPDWRATHNAQRLFNVCKPVSLPKSGSLLFYGPDDMHIEHVMVDLGLFGRIIGACHGGRQVTTRAIARANGAFVMTRDPAHYRADFRGYRELPFVD